MGDATGCCCLWAGLILQAGAEVLAAAAASSQAEVGRSLWGTGDTGLIDRNFVRLVGAVTQLISAEADT